jgi:adenylate kinase family enzyme
LHSNIPALAPVTNRIFSREKFAQVQFVYLVAPTCFGKGYLLKLFKNWVELLVKLKILNIGIVSFGEIIRDLLEADPAFKREYGPMVARGDLLPDDIAIILFEKAIDAMARNGMPNLVLVDGFCRSPRQIEFAANALYLAKTDQVFMLDANEMTCFQRFSHRCMTKSDGQTRLDSESGTFTKRYHMHMSMCSRLRELFKESDCRLIEIKDNGDIADVIFPKLKPHLEPTVLSATKSEKYEQLTVTA